MSDTGMFKMVGTRGNVVCGMLGRAIYVLRSSELERERKKGLMQLVGRQEMSQLELIKFAV